MTLMDDVAKGKAPFDFVDAERRERATAAFAKGIDCILKCQVVVDGQRTAWCAQHDEVTLKPAAARNVRAGVALRPGKRRPRAVLMSRRQSVAGNHRGRPRCRGLVREREDRRHSRRARSTRRKAATVPSKKTADAPPIWARFYEIGTNRPIFTGRERVVRYNYSEIERERRRGYAYYGDWPEELLSEELSGLGGEMGIARRN